VVLPAGPDPRTGEDLRAVADRIRGRVAGLRVEVPAPAGPLTVDGLSVSIGGALHPAHGSDLTAVLRVADAALYDAKRAGRDTVRMPAPPPPRA
jgi:GGDEF domain-containing protein